MVLEASFRKLDRLAAWILGTQIHEDLPRPLPAELIVTILIVWRVSLILKRKRLRIEPWQDSSFEKHVNIPHQVVGTQLSIRKICIS